MCAHTRTCTDTSLPISLSSLSLKLLNVCTCIYVHTRARTTQTTHTHSCLSLKLVCVSHRHRERVQQNKNNVSLLRVCMRICTCMHVYARTHTHTHTHTTGTGGATGQTFYTEGSLTAAGQVGGPWFCSLCMPAIVIEVSLSPIYARWSKSPVLCALYVCVCTQKHTHTYIYRHAYECLCVYVCGCGGGWLCEFTCISYIDVYPCACVFTGALSVDGGEHEWQSQPALCTIAVIQLRGQPRTALVSHVVTHVYIH